MKNNLKKAILIALIPTAFVLMTSFKGSHGNYTYPEGWNISEMDLKDGVYQGESNGFREGLIVEITIENGTLTNVEVIDHNEIGPQFYNRPIDKVPEKIIAEQQTEVDGVTGATATSVGIMSAVEDALKNAIK